jgi:glycine oxidase
MADHPSPDVVVVGAGVIGLAVAWQAARAGMTVTVVDPRPGRAASWAAAGMLAPVGEAHFGEDALTSLNLAAARAWPDFARTLEVASGLPVHYLESGTLMVAVDPSDQAAADDLLAYRRRLGLSAQTLSASACRHHEPLLAPGIRGGADLVDDHQVDNRRVIEALLAACRTQGVDLVDDPVTAVTVRAGRAVGVETGGGSSCTAGAVVVAAGCWSGLLGGIPDSVRPPVRPVKGLTLRLQAPEAVPALQRTVRGLVHGRTCYVVPRGDGTVVVGATVEEKGFDLSVQVGAVGDLLEDARRLIPSLEEYALVDTSTGLRPGSPDNAPIVGRTDVPGLILATGAYRNGILQAPATSFEVVRLVQEGDDSDDRVGPFAPFRPGRFRPAGSARGHRPTADINGSGPR